MTHLVNISKRSHLYVYTHVYNVNIILICRARRFSKLQNRNLEGKGHNNA
jgi:hypothetical protein